ncbi:chemokine binding protein [Skunkpox virus]|uniref:Chemokine binding protein n=1 Tax=Skunkpox virus TaxID=160796 RepID=A0A1C9KBH3_9POXV|nr:chemokine binding protein [Skunkpox virus]YP_009282905.1 chemokine binding protein [Skunkpox virus]AOP31480.1 chemokine binding protein [Skunkpox virus]AOP31690.1 chemokine binding protein [Skunkpox virus]
MKQQIIILACMCLTAMSSPTPLTQQQACKEENKHHMGIDVLVKATRKEHSQSQDKICQSVTTITETDEDAISTEDSKSTEEDSTESTEVVTRGDSTYYTVVGGGLETVVGFTGCPHIKSVSEYSDGDTVYTRLSSIAPWNKESTSTSISHEESLAMIKDCEVSLDLRCSDEDKESNVVDGPVLGSNLSHSKKSHGDLIGSTIVDTKCVKNFELSITLGDMCKESSDVTVKDVLKMVDGSVTTGGSDDTSVYETKLKSCV